MTEMKLANYILSALVLIFCTMFVWTLNYVATTCSAQTPIAISAFNG